MSFKELEIDQGGTGAKTTADARTNLSVESTTQLNARDTANRDRTNHTGTQAISTVTGLQTSLDGKADTVHTHTVSQISDLTATAAELNTLDGITATVAELNYTDGVTSNIQTQLDAKAPNSHVADVDAHEAGINAQTGTTYTLVLGDIRKQVTMNNTSANTLTVPPNSSVAFPVGTKILVTQLGAGSTTIAAGSGVTINAPASVALEIAEQYGSRGLQKVLTDAWVLI